MTVERFIPALTRGAVALIGTLAVGLVAVLAAGLDPVTTLQAIIDGALGSPYAIRQSLTEAVPVTLTALGVAVAFRAGLFNLGGDGQIYIGALGAVGVSLLFPELAPILLIPFALVVGMFGGLVWGCLAGVLRAKLAAVGNHHDDHAQLHCLLDHQLPGAWSTERSGGERLPAYARDPRGGPAAGLW